MNAPLPSVRNAIGIHALDFMDEAELVKALESSLYPGAKTESIKLVIANCRAQVLDPLTKPFHIVPMQVKEKRQSGSGWDYKWRDVVMPGIELYRTKAARTAEYAGIDSAQWGDDVELDLGGEAKTEWDEQARAKVEKGGKWPSLKIKVPEWCEVTVYRLVQGVRYAFSSGRVYWQESYATAGRETTLPNEMWKKRQRGQLEKCAEALALRRAFPELGGAPTAEEMQGKIIDAGAIEGTVTSRTIEPAGPSSKAEASTASTATSPQVSSPPEAGAGGSTQEGGELLSEGAKTTLRKQMERAGRTEADLIANGFPKVDEIRFPKFQVVMDWLKKNPAATSK